MKNIVYLFLFIFPASAFADPPSFASMTTNIDLSTAMLAVLDIFVALASFAILWTGSRKILEALGWGVDSTSYEHLDPNDISNYDLDPNDISNYDDFYDESGKR